MAVWGEILLSVFAIFGVYALFCRVLLWALGSGTTVTAVRLRGTESLGELEAVLNAARYSADTKEHKTSRVVVLLSELSDEGTMRFLAEQNAELYVRLNGEEEPDGANRRAFGHGGKRRV